MAQKFLSKMLERIQGFIGQLFFNAGLNCVKKAAEESATSAVSMATNMFIDSPFGVGTAKNLLTVAAQPFWDKVPKVDLATLISGIFYTLPSTESNELIDNGYINRIQGKDREKGSDQGNIPYVGLLVVSPVDGSVMISLGCKKGYAPGELNEHWTNPDDPRYLENPRFRQKTREGLSLAMRKMASIHFNALVKADAANDPFKRRFHEAAERELFAGAQVIDNDWQVQIDNFVQTAKIEGGGQALRP